MGVSETGNATKESDPFDNPLNADSAGGFVAFGVAFVYICFVVA